MFTHMKKPFLFSTVIIFILCAGQLQAQIPDFTSKKKAKENNHFLELGLSGNWLLRQVIPASDSSLLPGSSPYLFTARWGKDNWAIRFGAGGNYSRKEIQLEGFGDKEIYYNNSAHLRLGFEKRYRIGKRLVANLGLDAHAFYQNDEEIVDSGFDRVTFATRDKGLGLGPVLGLSYFFSERFACFVEGSVQGRFSQSETARLFKNFPQFDDEIQQTDHTEVQVVLPATFYLAFFF